VFTVLFKTLLFCLKYFNAPVNKLLAIIGLYLHIIISIYCIRLFIIIIFFFSSLRTCFTISWFTWSLQSGPVFYRGFLPANLFLFSFLKAFQLLLIGWKKASIESRPDWSDRVNHLYKPFICEQASTYLVDDQNLNLWLELLNAICL